MMELNGILLTIGCVLLLVILQQLSSIYRELRSVGAWLTAIGTHSDISDKVRTEILDELQQHRIDQQQMRDDLSEIKYVTDIIYKYKLPNRRDREFIDRVEVDNEVSDGIARAGRNMDE